MPSLNSKQTTPTSNIVGDTMASSTLTGKLEADVDIKASPEQFHEMFAHKPHHVHHTCYDKIQGCDLHEDGKAKKAKEVVEAVDPDKNLITFRVIEGELMVCSHDSSFAQERG
ncbi:hypothetical protein Gohar_021254 [Gossypium harknessii]|uniref:Bet v I/Major latex protein domain-containing protein n=1 Tax=Gossypium harknessii TaxID=34285 RepID=A0A7J9ICJ0_9ROSI|nr:hypothetical protein [Gossypium harknessii]